MAVAVEAARYAANGMPRWFQDGTGVNGERNGTSVVNLVAPVQPGLRYAWLWRGHVFLFDKTCARPTYEPGAGVRLLLIVVGLEAVRLTINWLGLPFTPFWLGVPIYLGLALLSVPFIAGLSWSQIGFQGWSKWNFTEKSYFIQILLAANIVFPMVFAPQLQAIFAQPSAMTSVWTVFIPYLFYGFYQEVLYRGIVQTELVRRWGPPAGILVSNALYTFGPQHYYYFLSSASLAVPMFAAIFGMGLVFAMVFRRSGNLWIVAVMHGIGNS
jgi:membrane protease YdiL (CAAX protease family)